MDYLAKVRRLNTVKLCTIALLCAISIGTDYVLYSLWNVKFMDLIVFVGGFCFGPLAGVSVGLISWAVYGVVNPQGFVLSVLVATAFSESIYGLAGGLLRKVVTNPRGEGWKAGVFFGSVGVILTVTYDILTNIAFGLTAGWNVVYAVVIGFVPFGIVHEVSNMVFFGFGSIPLISAISKITGGERNVNLEK